VFVLGGGLTISVEDDGDGGGSDDGGGSVVVASVASAELLPAPRRVGPE